MQTAKEFEMQINQAESDKEVRLNGKVYWEVKTGNTFTIGRNCMKGVISISRSGVVIDGSNAEIEAEIEDSTLVLLLSIPLSMILGLCLAGLLRMGDIKGAKVFQVLYYLPAVSSAVAMNIVWRYIFNNEFGIINLIIGKKIPWLSDDTLIKVAIIIKNSLNGMGTAMILYLAGMLSVPKDYYEASELDGAGKVKQFFSITLPLITPITFYLLITGLIGGLQSYADSQIFGAGVQGSQTIVYFIWARGINQSRYGLASAASVLLAVVIMIVTLIQFKLSDKWVYEE